MSKTPNVSSRPDPQGWLAQAESFNARGAEEIVGALTDRIDAEITLCERNVEHLSRELIGVLRAQEREQAIRAELAWNERKRDALRKARDAAVAEVRA